MRSTPPARSGRCPRSGAQIDPGWSPLITTPPFPSYVSCHSGASGAAATVLSAFFPAESAELHAWAAQAAASRLYAGIHFRTDNEVGLELGASVGEAALAAWGTSAGRR